MGLGVEAVVGLGLVAVGCVGHVEVYGVDVWGYESEVCLGVEGSVGGCCGGCGAF